MPHLISSKLDSLNWNVQAETFQPTQMQSDVAPPSNEKRAYSNRPAQGALLKEGTIMNRTERLQHTR